MSEMIFGLTIDVLTICGHSSLETQSNFLFCIPFCAKRNPIIKSNRSLPLLLLINMKVNQFGKHFRRCGAEQRRRRRCIQGTRNVTFSSFCPKLLHKKCWLLSLLLFRSRRTFLAFIEENSRVQMWNKSKSTLANVTTTRHKNLVAFVRLFLSQFVVWNLATNNTVATMLATNATIMMKTWWTAIFSYDQK